MSEIGKSEKSKSLLNNPDAVARDAARLPVLKVAKQKKRRLEAALISVPAVIDAQSNSAPNSGEFWRRMESKILQTLRYAGKNSDSTIKAQGAVIYHFYRTCCGRETDVEFAIQSVRRKHGIKYLRTQAGRGVSEPTMRTKWSILRGWYHCLGKGDALQPWADAQVEFRAATASSTGQPGRPIQKKRRPTLSRLDGATYRSLLERLRNDERDLTWFWLARMVGEAGLTIEEAVQFRPEAGLSVSPGFLTIMVGKGRVKRQIRITQELQPVVIDFKDWWLRSGLRKNLRFERHSAEKAKQSFAYRVRKHLTKLRPLASDQALASDTRLPEMPTQQLVLRGGN